ncbi:MAG: CBS domain-containing protein [Actinobacteria bacterium]|nr:CBS domain-containing protein [Actinomycetota bacterium]MBI3686261.1 CBS domain-containing protein [Actinomycetota bacterium]
MRVREAMNAPVLSVGPHHTLRAAARLMAARNVGAAAVIDPDTSGIGILTERDILRSLGAGQNPDLELAADHLTSDLVFAGTEWTVDQAAEAMVRGGFRHLIVLEDGEACGIVSVRDIVRTWSRLASAAG